MIHAAFYLPGGMTEDAAGFTSDAAQRFSRSMAEAVEGMGASLRQAAAALAAVTTTSDTPDH